MNIRALDIVSDLFGALFTAIFILIVALFYRLAHAPVFIPFADVAIQRFVTHALPTWSIQGGTTYIVWSHSEGVRALKLHLEDVVIVHKHSDKLKISSLYFRLSLPALFRGIIAPSTIEVPRLNIALKKQQPSATTKDEHQTRPLLSLPKKININVLNQSLTKHQISHFLASKNVHLLQSLFEEALSLLQRNPSYSGLLGYLQYISINNISLAAAHTTSPDESAVEGRFRFSFSRTRTRPLLFSGVLLNASLPTTIYVSASRNDRQKAHFLKNATPGGDLVLSVNIQNLNPSYLADNIPHLQFLQPLDLSVNARARIKLGGKNGQFRNASVHIAASQGSIIIPNHKNLIINRFDTTFSASPDDINISSFDISSSLLQAKIKGRLTRDHHQNEEKRFDALHIVELLKQNPQHYEAPSKWAFNLSSHSVFLYAPLLLIHPLYIKDFQFSSYFDEEKKTLTLDKLLIHFDLPGRNIHQSKDNFLLVQGSVGPILSQERPSLDLQLSLQHLPVSFVKNLWPYKLDPDIHGWVNNNVRGGLVSAGQIFFDIKPQAWNSALKEPPPDKKNLRISLTLQKSNLYYLRPMPPLFIETGTAQLDTTHFEAYIPKASANITEPLKKKSAIITLRDGHFRMPILTQQRNKAEIHFSLNGAAWAMLDLLNKEPLYLLKGTSLRSRDVGGDIQSHVTLSLPLSHLKPEEISFQATAIAKNFSSPDFLSFRISKGDIELLVNNKELTVKGSAKANDAPVSFVANKQLNSKTSPTLYTIEAYLDRAQRQDLGIDLFPYIQGTSQLTFKYLQSPDNKTKRGKVYINLTPSLIDIPEISFTKERGGKVHAQADFLETSTRKVFNNINITGSGLEVHGGVEFKNGAIKDVNLSVVHAGPNNNFHVFAHKASSFASKTYTIKITGETLDIHRLLQSSFLNGSLLNKKNSPAPTKTKVASKSKIQKSTDLFLNVDLKRVIGKNNLTFRNFSIELNRTNSLIDTFNVYGLEDSSHFMYGYYTPYRKGIGLLRFEAQNAGFLFRALGLYDNVKGGELQLQGAVNQKNKTHSFEGGLLVTNFYIMRQSILTRLLTLTSLRGLSDLLSQKGLGFDNLYSDIHISNVGVCLRDGSIVGAVLGATMDGEWNWKTSKISFQGTLTPAYSLNNFLGYIPLLGKILTSKKHEGIFGITYRISGPAKHPSIAVNPLSFLMPGFLRRVLTFSDKVNTSDRKKKNEVVPCPNS